ncbi:PQ-loop-domain-containing protein [Violaceomyces palustris]|uniref:PQ-loop-domain-containing protein n=1 Tax=Violaceomyces palustris TaxID=1673888 RepID=A0ACD0P7A6_9BASI|nr:PQ-loop-domain-containing protein [Violaceomyces palustris]
MPTLLPPSRPGLNILTHPATLGGPESQSHLLLTSLSRLLGWIYFTAWSVSFYPQAIANYRKKSTAGVSNDYLTLNVLGHASYAIFNLAFLLSQTVQKEYRQRHDGNQSVVRWNDAAFSVHAAFLSAFTLFQAWRYSAAAHRPHPRYHVSKPVSLSCLFILLLYSTSFFASWLGWIGWIDSVMLLSYVKLYVSLVKCIPQVKLNHQRKSTSGFSIENILLDITGGTLSLAQLFLDAGLSGDWSAITGDVGKFGLSLISMVFDGIFVAQHYFLYPDARSSVNGASEEQGPRSSSRSRSSSRGSRPRSTSRFVGTEREALL